jgi:hypothetical protein
MYTVQYSTSKMCRREALKRLSMYTEETTQKPPPPSAVQCTPTEQDICNLVILFYR